MAPQNASPSAIPDSEAVTRAAADLLASLGVDLVARGLERTPERMAQTLIGLLDRGHEPVATLMPSDGYEGPIVMRNLPFTGMCEHHLLPFSGTATIAYTAGEHIIGLSTLARVVEYFSTGLQLQERMTQEIADWLEAAVAPTGVGVRLEAEHFCMSMRGVGGPETKAETRIVRGAITVQDLS